MKVSEVRFSMAGLDRAKFVSDWFQIFLFIVVIFKTAREKFDMGLLIKLLLQLPHVCGGGFYATLKLPSRINIFGSNKECNIIWQHFSEWPSLLWNVFSVIFDTFLANPSRIGRCPDIASPNILFLNISSWLAEFSWYRWRTSSRRRTRDAATLTRIKTLPHPRKILFVNCLLVVCTRKWRFIIVFRKLNCSTATEVWVINGSSYFTIGLFRLFLAFTANN